MKTDLFIDYLDIKNIGISLPLQLFSKHLFSGFSAQYLNKLMNRFVFSFFR